MRARSCCYQHSEFIACSHDIRPHTEHTHTQVQYQICPPVAADRSEQHLSLSLHTGQSSKTTLPIHEVTIRAHCLSIPHAPQYWAALPTRTGLGIDFDNAGSMIQIQHISSFILAVKFDIRVPPSVEPCSQVANLQRPAVAI